MLSSTVFDDSAMLPVGFSIDEVESMPVPGRVLVCPPDEFDVIDVKNPFMEGNQGRVDRARARRQWEELVGIFKETDVAVERVPATKGCEDMVFCANPAFVFLDRDGTRVCVPSQMRHPSRRKEVPALRSFFESRGYSMRELGNPDWFFEGTGDGVLHPGKRLIWGGIGTRTQREVYPRLAALVQAPVLTLEIREPFYHLDTCFSILDGHTVMIYPGAFTPRGLALIRRVFPSVVETSHEEAHELMACNAAAFPGKHVVIQRGSARLVQELIRLGFRVWEADTDEFMKSGGSVFCMKMLFF